MASDCSYTFGHAQAAQTEVKLNPGPVAASRCTCALTMSARHAFGYPPALCKLNRQAAPVAQALAERPQHCVGAT
jgi:hypothetical protein